MDALKYYFVFFEMGSKNIIEKTILKDHVRFTSLDHAFDILGMRKEKRSTFMEHLGLTENNFPVIICCAPDWDDLLIGTDSPAILRLKEIVAQFQRLLEGKGKLAVYAKNKLNLEGVAKRIIIVESINDLKPDSFDILILDPESFMEMKQNNQLTDTFPYIVASNELIKIDDQEEYGLIDHPWVTLQSYKWDKKRQISLQAASALLSQFQRRYHPGDVRVIIVEDNSTEYDNIKERLASTFGESLYCQIYQPSSQKVNSKSTVFEDLIQKYEEVRPHILLFDVELIDEGFAYLKEEVSGADLAETMLESYGAECCIGVLSRVQLQDLSNFKKAGGLIMPKDTQFAELHNELLRRTTFFASLIGAFARKEGYANIFEHLNISINKYGLSDIVDKISVFINDGLSIYYDHPGILELPEFQIKRKKKNGGSKV
ncbi:hypothetical protein ACFL03_07915 [Thermodesulfobacteriota bacterium]